MFFCRELRTRLLGDAGKPRRTGHVVFTFTSVTWTLSTTLWRFPGEFSHLRTFSTVFKPQTPSSHPLPADALSPLPRGTHRWPLRSPHFPFSSVPEEEPFVPLNLRSSFSSGIIRLLLPAQAACSFNSFSTSAGSATSAYNQAPASPV